MNRNAVYFVTDDKFLGLTLLNARKLAALQDRNFDIHLFYQGAGDLEVLRQGADITVHRYTLSLPEGVRSSNLWPQVVYGRIFVPDMLGSRYERLLYLDADIYLWRDPRTLFEVDLGVHALGAVQDFSVANGGCPRRFKNKESWLQSIGIKGDDYFNSGVLLVDVDRWKQIDFNREIIEFMGSYGAAASMWDQDFLNHVFQGSWLELSPLANWQYTAIPKDVLAPYNPIITHFVGEQKPWHPDWPFDKAYQAYFWEGIGLPENTTSARKALKLKLKRMFSPKKIKEKEQVKERRQLEFLKKLL